MQKHIKQRLTSLRREHEAGVEMLADLNVRRVELEQTLLRIGGAMEVLQELLEPGEDSADAEDTEDTEGSEDTSSWAEASA